MEQQLDFLQDVEEEIYYERASAGLRFANYIIDSIGFYILYIILVFIIAFVTAILSNANNRYENAALIASDGMLFFIFFASVILYYTILEATSGRTLGKLITGTKVIMNNGSKPSWQTAFLRTLSRFVPFEAFSAFGGYPWHDQWTRTEVVKVRR